MQFHGLYIFHGDDMYHFWGWEMPWHFEAALEAGWPPAWEHMIELVESAIERYECS